MLKDILQKAQDAMRRVRYILRHEIWRKAEDEHSFHRNALYTFLRFFAIVLRGIDSNGVPNRAAGLILLTQGRALNGKVEQSP